VVVWVLSSDYALYDVYSLEADAIAEAEDLIYFWIKYDGGDWRPHHSYGDYYMSWTDGQSILSLQKALIR
jgi:hypothetical protein